MWILTLCAVTPLRDCHFSSLILLLISFVKLAQSPSEVPWTQSGRCVQGEGDLLPDHPPAIQKLMNDLNDFTLRERHLVLFHSSVGFDGYIWFTWSTEGAPSEVRVSSAPALCSLLPRC